MNSTVVHGVVGGVASELSGGEFGAGFFSAGFTRLAAPQIDKIDFDDSMARVVATAVVGGTASELAGGKFANGARTAAYLQLFVEAANHYAVFTGITADWRPGENYEETKYDFHEGGMREFDPTKPRQNVVGHNLLGKFCSQGDSCSKFLNAIPGVNATAEYHDRILNIPEIRNSIYWGDSAFLNFSTMPHSAIISYGAIVGNNLRGWHRDALAWQAARDLSDD